MIKKKKKRIKIDYKIKLKKGDLVKVIAGKDKGKEGKILLVNRKNGTVIVEQVNMKTMSKKSNGINPGGLIKKEFPIDCSNVMYLHNGVVTKIGYKIEIKEEDGKKVIIKKRVARKTGEVID